MRRVIKSIERVIKARCWPNRCRHHAELAPHTALVVDLPGFGDPAVGDAENDDLRHLYASSSGRDVEQVAGLGAAERHQGDDPVAFRDEIEQLEAPVGERRHR